MVKVNNIYIPLADNIKLQFEVQVQNWLTLFRFRWERGTEK